MVESENIQHFSLGKLRRHLNQAKGKGGKKKEDFQTNQKKNFDLVRKAEGVLLLTFNKYT